MGFGLRPFAVGSPSLSTTEAMPNKAPEPTKLKGVVICLISPPMFIFTVTMGINHAKCKRKPCRRGER